MRKKLRGLLLELLPRLCAALLALPSADALGADLYQIEVIVFARPGGGGEEHSASGKGLSYPLRVATLQAAAADASSVGAFQLLPNAERRLNNEETALSRRGFPILFHGAWRQPVETATRATGVLVNGGRGAGAQRELSGYVTLSAENYLHIDVNLWLSQFTAAGDNVIDSPQLPVPNGTITDPDIAPAAISKLFVLTQQRKLRSGELHYFDHPRFSALVVVKPVDQ
ncbi:MAG: CsiV family protein [Spongiibacteraceae bacterium]